jgi:pyridoxamine 5'-phosphate oxidase family protein
MTSAFSSAFTRGELAFIVEKRLGRMATVDPSGAPQVNPVSVYYNPETDTLDVGGHSMEASRKYRNVVRGSRVAIVIDDMTAAGIRCIEIRGDATAVVQPDDSAARTPGAIIRLHPRRIISWGIDAADVARGARDVG